MNTVTSILFSAAFLATLAGPEPAAACNPAVVSARTDFPAAAQDQRKHGVVRVSVTLQEDGHAGRAVVFRSSGHSVLDHAAVQSVQEYWRFDVAKCTAADLAVARTVDVVYRRTSGLTVSGTVNRKFRTSAAKLAADARCDVTRMSSDTKIFACKDEAASSLASK